MSPFEISTGSCKPPLTAGTSRENKTLKTFQVSWEKQKVTKDRPGRLTELSCLIWFISSQKRIQRTLQPGPRLASMKYILPK